MSRKHLIPLMALLFMAVVSSATPPMQEVPTLDLHSIPVSEWLNGGKKTEIAWETGTRSTLRMDQRIEISYWAEISAKTLNRSGREHELFLISRFSTLEGEWLTETAVARKGFAEAPSNDSQIRFSEAVVARPGDYLLWMILYDRKTGLHNMDRLKIRVEGISNDPLPELYAHQNAIEPTYHGESQQSEIGAVPSALYLQVENKRPIDVRLIGTLSPPPSQFERGRTVRRASDATTSALAAFSQMTLNEGSISITGLDTMLSEVILEENGRRSIAWSALKDAFRKVETRAISFSTGTRRRINGTFFKEFLLGWLKPGGSAAGDNDQRRKVVIIITGPPQFDRETVVIPLQPDEGCDCKIYHLRVNPAGGRGIDDLAAILKPLQPRTFELRAAIDLRKALAAIIQELGTL